ncbi:MAG: 4-hydroxythreonine-4-phosphate dehydrogenase PdxA [Gemmatimonadetes bacterium]|nr:4-hydroxythreonine-4-phosphate dehydrogenase PdxA [Gemmatimonadota bacterium]NNL30879.1 4-hydroxythreonine-4-phosphate dehydrogenase PdxA [Gemmatimonadota bacterium]
MALRLAVTPGDPRGVGPEVALHAIRRFQESDPTVDLSVVGPDGLLQLDDLSKLAEAHRKRNDAVAAGTVAARSIERAVDMARSGDVHAIVTAPLHKPSLHAAGWPVPGHTEMLARLADVEHVGMLMAAERTKLGSALRVLLVTTHMALRDVPRALTSERISEQVALLHRSLESDWGLPAPRIGLCALNPHASDGGLFGDEEARVYAPALTSLRASGIPASGPLPADTVFSRALSGDFDAVAAPYHDVGMAAFKTVSFGSGVNVTLGLPFVRTSPDHGTAFDIAGRGKADPSSMIEALVLAHRLAKNRFDTPHADV